VGFTMVTDENSRIYNTFDAHRLLHWAGLVGDQKALKHALFDAYFTDNESPADHEVLVAAAMKAGLDPDAAHQVLTSGQYAQEVRDAERAWQAAGDQLGAGRGDQRPLPDLGRPAAGVFRAGLAPDRRRGLTGVRSNIFTVKRSLSWSRAFILRTGIIAMTNQTSAKTTFERELVALIPHLRAFGRSLTGNASHGDDLAQDALPRPWPRGSPIRRAPT
jgi:hypothetical protein